MWLKRVILLCLFLLGINLVFTAQVIGQNSNLLTPNRDCQNPILNFNWFGIIPNDNLFCYQWNLREYPGINIREAWRETQGEGVTVAVIDSGIDFSSGDFDVAHFVNGYDYKRGSEIKITQNIQDTQDRSPDHLRHGTHVAGTIAQATNNRIGTAGIAYKAKLMPMRIDLEQNTDDSSDKKNIAKTGEEVAEAIREAVKRGADIINLSIQSPKENEPEIQTAAEDAYNQGKVIVAAAGNQKQGIQSSPVFHNSDLPGKIVHGLIVAASNDSKPAVYSNIDGANIYAPGGELDVSVQLDSDDSGCKFLLADENIPKELIRGIAQTDKKEGKLGVRFCQGTSQASAHVTGVAALVISVLKKGHITVYPDLVISIIQESAHIAEYDRSKNCSCIGKLHSPDSRHYLDAEYAINLAKLIVRNHTRFSKSNITIFQQVSDLVQQNFAELSRREKTRIELFMDNLLTVAAWLVLLLCFYLLSNLYNLSRLQFFLAMLISTNGGLWLMSQSNNHSVTHTVVLFILPSIAILLLIDPLVHNEFWKWISLGSAMGAGISLAYGTSVLNTEIIPFSLSPLVLIPCSILICLPAWILIKAEEQHFAWGISIGAVITLVTHAFLFSRNLAIVLVVCAGIIFLLSHFLIDTHYRGLNFHSATGIAVILANTTFISQKYLSHLPQWFPAIFLSLTVISYFVAWLKPNVVT